MAKADFGREEKENGIKRKKSGTKSRLLKLV
jgi:hypothetical protein